MGATDIGIERMRDFESSTNNNLRFFPPFKLGLREHVKRACLEAGCVAYQCIRNIELPDPKLFGWWMVNGRYLPKWQEIQEPIDALFVTTTCNCEAQMQQLSMQSAKARVHHLL